MAGFKDTVENKAATNVDKPAKDYNAGVDRSRDELRNEAKQVKSELKIKLQAEEKLRKASLKNQTMLQRKKLEDMKRAGKISDADYRRRSEELTDWEKSERIKVEADIAAKKSELTGKATEILIQEEAKARIDSIKNSVQEENNLRLAAFQNRLFNESAYRMQQENDLLRQMADIAKQNAVDEYNLKKEQMDSLAQLQLAGQDELVQEYLEKMSEADKKMYADRLLMAKGQQVSERHKKALEHTDVANRETGDKVTANLSAKLGDSPLGDGIATALGDAVANANATVNAAITDTLQKLEASFSLADYESTIAVHLEDSGLTFDRINNLFQGQALSSPYFRYEDLLKNLQSAVETGRTESASQRAFLMTVTDKVVQTFNALDENMMNLIRVQQVDTTASRMGMEAYLTRMFNFYFNDHSYLVKSFDGVAASLMEVSAQMPNAAAGVEFEYQAQKWLGAMGSVGAVDNTLTSIAEALGAIGTGNITKMSSNEQMQNLMVMAMNRAGLNYADLLTRGINSQQTNELMKAVINYIQYLYGSTDSNVIRSQYAELFGITITDMRAMANLTDQMISELYQSAMSYDDTLTELNRQFSKVSGRMSIGEKLNNMLDNIIATTGASIANNPVLYMTYNALDMIEGITGGIEIPFVNVMGFGLDLNMKLTEIGKMAVGGLGMLGNFISGIGALFKGGMWNVDAWNVRSTKGKNLSGYKSAGQLETTTSSMSYVSNTNETGSSQSLVDQQTKSGEDITGDSKQDADTEMKKLELILEILQNKHSPIAVSISSGGTNPIYQPTQSFGG